MHCIITTPPFVKASSQKEPKTEQQHTKKREIKYYAQHPIVVKTVRFLVQFDIPHPLNWQLIYMSVSVCMLYNVRKLPS